MAWVVLTLAGAGFGLGLEGIWQERVDKVTVGLFVMLVGLALSLWGPR